MSQHKDGKTDSHSPNSGQDSPDLSRRDGRAHLGEEYSTIGQLLRASHTTLLGPNLALSERSRDQQLAGVDELQSKDEKDQEPQGVGATTDLQQGNAGTRKSG